MVGTKNTLMDFTNHLWLETNDAYASSAAYFNNTDPTASVFSVGTSSQTNGVNNILAYCWHSVEGYSKIGSYKGNGNVDGSFIYTGFAPAYVLRKRINSTGSWPIQDTARSPYNIVNAIVYADTTASELASENEIDFVSNGFKIRATDTHGNASGGIYLYMAFAENSFKHATAR
jgi:hypothetical protein